MRVPVRLPSLAFAAWTILIFASIPRSTRWQQAIVDLLGSGVFRTLILGSLAAFGLGILVIMYRWRRPLHRSLGALGLLAAAALWIGKLRGPAEPLHLIQYGGLSVLALNMLRCRFRDLGLYPATVLLVTLVGTLDEIVQWMTPGRFFDPADIALNAGLGTLTTACLAILGWPQGLARTMTWRPVAVLGLAEALLLLACAVNTPALIEQTTGRLPGLEYLGKSASTRMVDYGYIHQTVTGAQFGSRLSAEALRAADQQRQHEAATVLDQHPAFDDLEAFTQEFSPGNDPFLFELRLHLFFRDRKLARGRRATTDAERQRLATEARHQQRILEEFFSQTLRRSTRSLDPEAETFIKTWERQQAKTRPYVSPVGRDLITGASREQAVAVLLTLGALAGIPLLAPWLAEAKP